MNRKTCIKWIYWTGIILLSLSATACSHLATSAADSPLKQFAQQIRSEVKTLDLKPGEQVFIPVTVKNTGTEVWPAMATNYPVHLSYLWFDGSKQLDINTPRTFLSGDLAPGAEQALKAVVIGPQTPGAYTAKFTMVQERVAWFSATGAASFDVPVTVR